MRFALLALLAGCVNYNELVRVHVVDPARVTVSPPTEHGVTLSHDSEGSVSAHCTWCEYDSDRFVLTPWGSVELVGDPANLERVGGDLHMRFAYVAPLPCHKGGGLCERPAFSIEVTTPRDNVRAIDFERSVSRQYGEMFGAKTAIVAGVLAGLLGAALMTYDVGWATNSHLIVGGVALNFLALGTFFTATGVRTLTARDSLTPVAP